MRTLLPIALAAVAVVLVACGGDDSTTSSTLPVRTITETSQPPTSAEDGEPSTTTEAEAENQDEDDARPQPGSGIGAASPVIATTAVLTDEGSIAQACGSYVTEALLRSAYGGEGNCIAARRDRALARSISVAPGVERGSTHIVVVPKGGPYDRARVEVELVEEDGGFRVDALEAHVPAGP